MIPESKFHESMVFEDVWKILPKNIWLGRSPADAAYCDGICLDAAREHGVPSLHAIKKNSRDFEEPETLYQKLVNFAHHWPTRFAALTAKRDHAETVFSMFDKLLGYRLRCRKKAGRRYEVRIKFYLFNLIQLAMR